MTEGGPLALDAGATATAPLQADVLAQLPDPTLAPIALVVVPIVAAAVALLAGLVRDRSGWAVAVVALVGEAALAAWTLAAVWQQEALVHVLGGYGRPAGGLAVGIELIADGLSAPLVVVVAAVALGTLAISRSAGPRGNAVYAAYLLLVGGLMGVLLTGDVFNLFVFLEITGLATYTLVAARQEAEAAVAALKYLIVGTTGASLYLLGVGYLFLATGTLNMRDLSQTMACEGSVGAVECPLYTDPLVVAGFGLITAGLFVKAAIFPLHAWQPDAYQRAPDAVTTVVSALVSTAAAYAFARIALGVFTPAFFAAVPIAATAVVTLASVSVVAGATLAVLQTNVKRTFAYSSVSQFGLVIAAVGVAVHPAATSVSSSAATGAAASAATSAAGSAAGGVPSAARFALLGAAIHLVGHAVVKGGVFGAATGLSEATGARSIAEYAELGRRSPVLAGCLAVLGLTLVGVPPAVGFLGKWYIALGAIRAGMWPVAAVVLASTLLTLAYVARLIERLYFTPSEAAISVDADAGADHAGGDDAVAADGSGRTAAADGSGPTETADGHGRTETADAGPQGTVVHRLLPIDDGVPLGVVAYVVVAAIAAVALGFAGDAFAELLEPVVTEVFAG